MDKAIEIVLILHAIERLVSIGLGGLSIYLGWSLFRKNLDSNGEADLRHLGWRITLKRVGPGVFFALFGATVVAISLSRPVTADIKESWLKPTNAYTGASFDDHGVRSLPSAEAAGLQHMSEINISGLGSGPAEARRLSDVHALNSAINLGRVNRNDAAIIRAAIDDLRRGANRLEQIRDAIVVQQFGKEAVDLWNEKGEKYQRDRNNLTKAEQDRDAPTLIKLMPWMMDGMESEASVAK